MSLLQCACLIDEREGKLLLVRVRQNRHWYLPGGKIEAGEVPQSALRREIAEELGVCLAPESIRYLYTVVGPAYGQPGDVELICFTGRWDGQPRPLGEVGDVRWLETNEPHLFAPVVRILLEKHLRGERSALLLP